LHLGSPHSFIDALCSLARGLAHDDLLGNPRFFPNNSLLFGLAHLECPLLKRVLWRALYNRAGRGIDRPALDVHALLTKPDFLLHRLLDAVRTDSNAAATDFALAHPELFLDYRNCFPLIVDVIVALSAGLRGSVGIGTRAPP